MPRMEGLVIAVAVMVMIVTAWIILYTLISGLGVVVYRLAGRRREQLEDVPLTFWVGWAALIAYLQVWHLFFRVSPNSAIPVILIGAIGAWSGRRDFWAWIQRLLKHPLVLVGLGVIVLLAVFFSWRGIYTYDDGLYHLQDVKWITNYSIVPGLGNLHGRLALNTTHTLYIAFLQEFPLIPPARHIAHGLMLMAFAIQATTALIAILRREATTMDNPFYVLIFPNLMYVTVWTTPYLPTIKNDYAILLLGLVLSAQILKYGQRLFTQEEGRQLDWSTLWALSLIAVVGVTVKLSLIVFSVGLLLVLLASAFRRTLLIGLALFVSITGVWMARGVILSGYPLFPLDALPVPVEWRMGDFWIQLERDGIIGWARRPNLQFMDTIGNYDWVMDWFKANTSDKFRVYDFLVPLVIALLLFASYVALMVKKKRKLLAEEGLWILPTVAFVALIYWFFSAPAVRFGWYIFWTLAISLLMLTLKRANLLSNRRVIVGIAAILWVPFMIVVSQHWLWFESPYGFDEDTVFPSSPVPDIAIETTQSGLEVYIPLNETDQCWEVPLPCTPDNRFLEGLALREPGNLGSGFVVESDQSAD